MDNIKGISGSLMSIGWKSVMVVATLWVGRSMETLVGIRLSRGEVVRVGCSRVPVV